MSQAAQVEGAKIIIQIVQDVASDHDMVLDDIEWAPDPINAAKSCEFYSLRVRQGEKQEELEFPREKLESISSDKDAQQRAKEILTDFLEAMLSYE